MNARRLDLVARLEHAEADGANEFGERKVALAAAERALARYRELGDILGIAQAQCLAGGSLGFSGDPRRRSRCCKRPWRQRASWAIAG